MVVRDPDDAEKRAIATAKQAIARLSDTFHFDMGNVLTRRAKGRHELGAPAVPIRMRWPFDNLGCTVFSLDSRADLKTRLHLRNRLLSCSDGAFLGIVWVPDYRWQRL